MITKYLSIDAVLKGYDAVSMLYPYIPPMTIWRSWEYAAYQRYELPSPALDIGCGDGRFFSLVWPALKDVTGVDINSNAVEEARQSGLYREVRLSAAHQLPFPRESFPSVFANCSLEHMDHLPDVLRRIHDCLCSGGIFLLSVVTEKFIEWSTLPLLMGLSGDADPGRRLQTEYEEYHKLTQAIPVSQWEIYLGRAGFKVIEHIPILPELTSRLFLFVDHLWHLKRPGGEVGDLLYPYLLGLPNFPEAFRHILSGVLHMEKDFSVGSGAVFFAKRG